MKVGIRMPTLLSQAGVESLGSLPRWAQQVEQHGFDSAWFLDHLLAAEYVFGSATLEPLIAMANVAGATDEINIGAAVLVAPLRNRVWLAKQLGTLSAIAGDRMLLGVGAGWDEREFRASDVARPERGARLDRVLADVRTARGTGVLQVSGIPIEPAPSVWAAVLVGGGGSSTVQEGGSPTRIAPAVVDRVARADGWFVRSSAPSDLWTADLKEILRRRVELGINPGAFAVFRSCFLHVSLATTRNEALAEQVESMKQLGWTGDRTSFVLQHPHGTIDELVDWFEKDSRAGVDHIVIHPVGELSTQLQRIARYLRKPLVTMVGS